MITMPPFHEHHTSYSWTPWSPFHEHHTSHFMNTVPPIHDDHHASYSWWTPCPIQTPSLPLIDIILLNHNTGKMATVNWLFCNYTAAWQEKRRWGCCCCCWIRGVQIKQNPWNSVWSACCHCAVWQIIPVLSVCQYEATMKNTREHHSKYTMHLQLYSRFVVKQTFQQFKLGTSLLSSQSQLWTCFFLPVCQKLYYKCLALI